jgi:hypothetical protein
MTYFVALLISISCFFSQETPFLNSSERMMLINEISGDRSFEHIRVLTQWHRDSGMDGYFKAADYVVETAKKLGFEDVKFIEQPLRGGNYTAIEAELWIVDPIEYKLADIGDHALYLSDGSSSANIEKAELVFIDGIDKDEFEKLDLKGKIVLTASSPYRAVATAVWKKGALGVVCFPTSESRSAYDFPDQLAWTRIPRDEEKPTFSFNLQPRKGELLKEILASESTKDFLRTGEKFKGGKLFLKAKVKTKMTYKTGKTGFVEAWIRGTESEKYKNQEIVLTAHLQEEQGSANDDGSGCGNLLELGRVFNKLIKEGKIQRPKRDLRFWWTDEIYSEYRYFSDYPDEAKKILVNLHQDMTGAKQSIGNRTQNLIYAPHSITSYLDAIFESIGNYVINSNNPFITAGRMGGYPRPHSVEIYSSRGSRENFNARFVPFFNASDNLNFVEGIIGVPSVALINWDDYYIHSSDDDLWQIDQTQLKRNNFIIAAMAYFIGKADKNDFDLILSQTFAQGQMRLSNDLSKAVEESQINQDKNEAYKNSMILIEQGILREKRAIMSASVFAEGDKSLLNKIDKLSVELDKISGNYQSQINEIYNSLAKTNKGSELSSMELAASKKIVKNNSNIEDYFNNRNAVRYRTNLHSTIRFEIFNFVDGKRSYFDIYKAVKAENLAASRFYYGDVKLEDVVKLLDEAVEKKALELSN